MNSIELTREELVLIRHAVSAFITDFGHEEHDLLHRLRHLLAKLPDPA